METLYTAVVTAKGGRDGHVNSTDGIIDFDIRKPKEMGGQGGSPNPEQLFAAAWGSCYLEALSAVSQNEGVDVAEASVDVKVSFNQDGDAVALSAALDVHIPGMIPEEAQKLADEAHKTCPYSKATRGNIEVNVKAF